MLDFGMLVAAVQFEVAWEDKPANHAIIERMLRDAKIAPGTYVLLPELGDTGFSFDLAKIVAGRSLTWARTLARDLGAYGFNRGSPRTEVTAGAGIALRSSHRRGRFSASTGRSTRSATAASHSTIRAVIASSSAIATVPRCAR